MESAVADIENFIKFMNVSISIWWYKETEQKYEGVGADRKKTRIGPKYSTAITNKLFFDIDCMRTDGSHIKENYAGTMALWDWAVEHNYRREIAFTGGGYQMTIGAKLIPENYYNTIHHVADTVNVEIDDAISLTRMRRYIGSYNWGNDKKAARNCYCISLQEHEVHMPWWKHINLSQKKRTEIYKYGTKIYKKTTIGPYKRKQLALDTRTDFTVGTTAGEILDDYGYAYTDICISIKKIIEQPHVKHMERILVIKYLKDIVGISFADCVLLLPKLLTASHGNLTDGQHSVMERQPDTVYSRGLRFMPSKMKEEGYCDNDCTKCSDYLATLRKIQKMIK